jgi:hypothetical protein
VKIMAIGALTEAQRQEHISNAESFRLCDARRRRSMSGEPVRAAEETPQAVDSKPSDE